MVSMRALGGTIGLLFAVVATAGIFDDPKNLKVLPDDIEAEALRRTMRSFSFDLGVGCESCHVGEANQPIESFDFAADDKSMKESARLMMRMVADLNDRELAKLPETDHDRIAVRCATCHRGQARPILIGDALAAAYEVGGVPAAVTRYRALKSEFFGSDSYDFTELPRLLFADSLVAKQDHAGSIAFLRELHDEHGAGFRTDAKLGDIYLLLDDRQNAIASYEAALSRAPPARAEGIRKRLAGLKEERP